VNIFLEMYKNFVCGFYTFRKGIMARVIDSVKIFFKIQNHIRAVKSTNELSITAFGYSNIAPRLMVMMILTHVYGRDCSLISDLFFDTLFWKILLST